MNKNKIFINLWRHLTLKKAKAYNIIYHQINQACFSKYKLRKLLILNSINILGKYLMIKLRIKYILKNRSINIHRILFYQKVPLFLYRIKAFKTIYNSRIWIFNTKIFNQSQYNNRFNFKIIKLSSKIKFLDNC